MHNQPTYESVCKQADSLPINKERVTLREKAINLADLTGDERLQFIARQQFLEDVSHEGSFPEKYFTVFPWMLNYIKKSGSNYDKTMVLWYYKWVLMSMPEFGTISKQQILNTLEDMRKWYVEFGSTEKMYHLYAAVLHGEHFGDPIKSKEHYKRWIRFKRRDFLDDCEACIINRQVSLLLGDNNLPKALKIAEPLVSEKLTCRHVPKDTYTTLLLPLLKAKEEERSAEMARKLSKKLQKITYGNNYYNAHTLIIYNSQKREYTAALKWFEKYFAPAYRQKNLDYRFYFYVAAAYLFRRIDKESIKMKLQPDAPFYDAVGSYDVETVAVWFDAETNRLCELFQNRNGNDFFNLKKQALLNI